MILNALKYKINVLCYYFRWTFLRKQRSYIKIYLKFCCIMKKLRKKHNKEDAYDITERYLRFKKYCNNKESQLILKNLRDKIANICNDTGIKQWDVKELIKKDFDLDV